MKLNLGCSDDLREGFLNVDTMPLAEIVERTAGTDRAVQNWGRNYQQVDLSGQQDGPLFGSGGAWVSLVEPKPWPWETSTVDRIMAHDVFEHIDNLKYRGNKGAIWCMNEAHRVLKPGGKLDLIVPCLDHEGKGVAPGCDPTHVQTWLGDWRYYFDEAFNHQAGERGRLGPGMGITALFRSVGGASVAGMSDPLGKWEPIQYAAKDPNRHKLFLILEAVK